MKLQSLSLRQPQLTRERLVNRDGHRGSFRDRLRAAKAVDLVNNHRVVPVRGGYDRVLPIDRSLLVK